MFIWLDKERRPYNTWFFFTGAERSCAGKDIFTDTVNEKLCFNNLTRIDMLTDIHPKLPMRNKAATRDFYLNLLGFQQFGSVDYDGYLMIQKDRVQIHFFEFKDLDPKENYGQVYIRTDDIDELYKLALNRKLSIPEAGHLQMKPWRQKEFSLLDPDFNLLTFGQALI